MYNNNNFSGHKIRLLKIASGALFVYLFTIVQAAVAQQPTSKVNPCPRIFYEEPHRDRVMVPPGCPPNAATLRQMNQQQTTGSQTTGSQGAVVPAYPTNQRPSTVIQPPVPETRQTAIATVRPTSGTVNVRLRNNTNAGISYQAIGYTQPRYLAGGQEFVLRGLPTPVSITLVRQDGGFIEVKPISSSEGILSISLDETSNFDNNQGVLRIQEDGQVFLN